MNWHKSGQRPRPVLSSPQSRIAIGIGIAVDVASIPVPFPAGALGASLPPGSLRNAG
jgi:hypothetical protein